MIPAQAVEAAAKVMASQTDEPPYGESSELDAEYRRDAREILEAAAPHIRAQALEDAADKFGEAASWSDSKPSPEQVQRWLRAGATAERGSSGDD